MKKILISVISLALLTSCSAAPVVKSPVTLSAGTSSATEGAQVSVKFDFESFKTLATADGTAPKLVSDVSQAKLYLVTSNTDPLSAVTFSSGMLSFSGTSQTYTFGNVPQGGPYYVAVELFDNTSANIVEPVSYGGTTGTAGISVSTNSVTVNAQNQVSHNSALTVNPVLKSGTGATIDSTVTPTDGAGASGPITIN